MNKNWRFAPNHVTKNQYITWANNQLLYIQNTVAISPSQSRSINLPSMSYRIIYDKLVKPNVTIWPTHRIAFI